MQQMLYYDPFYGVRTGDGLPEIRKVGLEDRPGISLMEDGRIRVLYYAPGGRAGH